MPIDVADRGRFTDPDGLQTTIFSPFVLMPLTVEAKLLLK